MKLVDYILGRGDWFVYIDERWYGKFGVSNGEIFYSGGWGAMWDGWFYWQAAKKARSLNRKVILTKDKNIKSKKEILEQLDSLEKARKQLERELERGRIGL